MTTESSKPLDGEIVPHGEKTPVDDRMIVRQEAKVRAGFWKTFKKAFRVIPFSDDLVAAYYCALDPKTPTKVRVTLLGALAYFVLPVDMVPDFIAAFGFTDDITVLTAAIMAVKGHIKDEHRDAARKALEDEA